MRLSTVAAAVVATTGAATMILSAGQASASPAPAALGSAGTASTAAWWSGPTGRVGLPWAGGWGVWRACAARELRGVVEPPQAGAGQRYSRLVVTNTGYRTCWLFGYSAMRLHDAAGHALPTTLRATRNPGPSLVLLRPGERAAVNLHWGVVPGPGEPDDQPCEPDPASLLVWPPLRFRPVVVAWSFGPVCQHGLIDVSAYFKL